MKKIYACLVFYLVICSQLYAKYENTLNPAITILSLSATDFCPEQTGFISFTSTITTATTYAVQISNFDGTFGSNPTVLGTGGSSPVTFTLPSLDSETGNLYRLRIVNVQNPAQVSLPSPVIFFNSITTSVQNVFGSTTIDLCQGSAVKLYAKLNKSDNNDVTYQWEKDGSRIIGATTSTYIATQGGSYSVYVNKRGCGYNSSAPSTYVNASRTSIGGIGEDYETESIYQCEGSTVKLKALNHSEFVSYTWKKDDVIIPNETNGCLNVTQSGVYSLKTSDLNCSNNNNTYVYSKEFIFGSVLPSQIAVYGYGTEKDTISICADRTYKMYFDSNSSFYKKDNFTYNFQWKKDGEIIEGAEKDNFITSSSGIYSLKVTQGDCSTTSKLLVLSPPNSIPNVKVSGSTNICAGVTPTLLYVDYFSTCGSLQWQKNQIDIPSAIYSNYQPSESGSYRIKISQGNNVNFTNAVTITVGMSPSYKISSPFDTITCTAYGFYYLDMESFYPFPGATFQWYKDGSIMSGQTMRQLNTYSEGAYKLKVSVGSCEGFSNQMNLVKRDYLTKPTIVAVNGTMLCENAFTRLAPRGIYSSIRWKRNGINIPTTSNSVNATQSGIYTVSVTQGTCTAESDPIKINVGDRQQTIKTADWSNPAAWSCGTIPTVAEDVLINKSHTVSLPNGYTGFLKNLENNGNIVHGTNAQLKFLQN